jgi:hypothetical protein
MGGYIYMKQRKKILTPITNGEEVLKKNTVTWKRTQFKQKLRFFRLTEAYVNQ